MPEACAHGAQRSARWLGPWICRWRPRALPAFAAVRDACSAAVRLGLCQPTRAAAVQREVLASGVRACRRSRTPRAAPAVDAAHCAHDLLEMRLFRLMRFFLLAALPSHPAAAPPRFFFGGFSDVSSKFCASRLLFCSTIMRAGSAPSPVSGCKTLVKPCQRRLDSVQSCAYALLLHIGLQKLLSHR